MSVSVPVADGYKPPPCSISMPPSSATTLSEAGSRRLDTAASAMTPLEPTAPVGCPRSNRAACSISELKVTLPPVDLIETPLSALMLVTYGTRLIGDGSLDDVNDITGD